MIEYKYLIEIPSKQAFPIPLLKANGIIGCEPNRGKE